MIFALSEKLRILPMKGANLSQRAVGKFDLGRVVDADLVGGLVHCHGGEGIARPSRGPKPVAVRPPWEGTATGLASYVW